MVETEDCIFSYDRDYLHNQNTAVVSLTLHLRGGASFISVFLDRLISEGWLLDIANHSWKINFRDRMGLPLASSRN